MWSYIIGKGGIDTESDTEKMRERESVIDWQREKNSKRDRDREEDRQINKSKWNMIWSTHIIPV